MQIKKAKIIARNWTEQFAKNHNIAGAVINGSAGYLKDSDILPETSDLDINLYTECPENFEKLGKQVYNGLLIEPSVLSLSMIIPRKKALVTYEIAGSFRSTNLILYDGSGIISDTTKYVSAHFSEPYYIKKRCEKVYKKIQNGINGFNHSMSILDNINSWLFPAGICTHGVLVADLKNPTVRLRYLKAYESLQKNGMENVYGGFLDLLGCRNISAAEIMFFLKELEITFNLAAENIKSDYPFKNDISMEAKHVAIGGSYELIEMGHHREAVFWILVTFERCHKVLRQDAPAIHIERFPMFLDFLKLLGITDNGSIKAKTENILSFLPKLTEINDLIIEKISRQ